MRAFVRKPAPSIVDCQLTHLQREPIDPARAVSQHAAYVATLERLGARVVWLPELDDAPDGVFVEDAAVIVPEAGVITRPAPAPRRRETPSVQTALLEIMPLTVVEAPVTLEGGDVLRIGKRLWVGLSARTNQAGVAALANALKPYGYEVRGVDLGRVLHLKSAVTAIGEDTVLLNPAWIDPALFSGMRVLEVDQDEPLAANTLTLGGVTLISAVYPKTARRVAEAGFEIAPLDVSELHKAEAGLTCMSLIVGEKA